MLSGILKVLNYFTGKKWGVPVMEIFAGTSSKAQKSMLHNNVQ